MPANYQPAGLGVFEWQPLEDITRAIPVQNTWYYSAELTNARIYDIVVNVSIAGETIEVQAVIDGQTIPANGGVQGAGDDFYVFRFLSGGAAAPIESLDLATIDQNRSFLLEGKSIVIGWRKTTAAGANPIKVGVSWGQKTP